MKTLRFVTVLLIVVVMSACTRTLFSDLDVAHITLTDFFDHLSKGEYAETDALYGGDYSPLQG